MTDVEERMALACERIHEIGTELADGARSGGQQKVAEKICPFYLELNDYLCRLIAVYRERSAEDAENTAQQLHSPKSWEELAAQNRELYAPVLPGQYEKSFANPAYAVKQLGLENGQLFSFLAAELYSMVSSAFFGETMELLIRLELYIEIYGICECSCVECGTLPGTEELQQVLYWFISDYSEDESEQRVRAMVDADCPENQYFYQLIMKSDLTDLRYLYDYGCYITESELRTAGHLNELPQETIDVMADTYTEGYRIGFVVGNKPLEKKETVNIRYCAGFERVIRKAIQNFETMGLRPVIYRSSDSIFHKKGNLKMGFYGAIANKQMDYDHKEDEALFFDGSLKTRRLETLKEAYEAVKDKANRHAGPAVMEIFGETPFGPVSKPENPKLSEVQQAWKVEYAQAAGAMGSEYIPGEERSFTIIAFPVPEIGAQYEAIFDEIIRINTLDYKLYSGIQKTLINALNQADHVIIRGRNGNRTDMVVQLYPLTDPQTQTIFENCVADVNIPVGEVFTSPVLEGTHGTLHVSHVFLNELFYQDLEITFENGMTQKCTCKNYVNERENEEYMRENVLFHHKSLPIGEFAIGTNTTAYMAAQKYGIADKLPILIAEKMGPHFAVGDTCYSHSEDVIVCNPDGKEIVAKDNSVSVLRKTNPEKAYFSCHTDITIPYDELGEITAVCADGRKITLIREGRFVLPGCEKLNEPFEV